MTYFRYFLDCLWSCSIGTRSIKGTNTKSSCARGTCGRNNYSIGDTYIKNADIRDDFIGNICIEDTGGIGIIKRLGIHLQLS